MLRLSYKLVVAALIAGATLVGPDVAQAEDDSTAVFSGRDVFCGFFFGTGPIAPRFRDLHTLATNLAADSDGNVDVREVYARVERCRDAFMEGRTIEEIGEPWSASTEFGGRYRALIDALLREIEKQDKEFLGRFGDAMQAGDQALVATAIKDGCLRLSEAFEVLGLGAALSPEAASTDDYLKVWSAMVWAVSDDIMSEDCCRPGCIDTGTLGGGTVTVSNRLPLLGEMVIFTVSGAIDSGGRKKVCEGGAAATVPIPPASVTYRWEMVGPLGEESSGAGSTTSVVVDNCGTWRVAFYAEAARECPPSPFIVGVQAATAYGFAPCPGGVPSLSEVRLLFASVRGCLEERFGSLINTVRMEQALDAMGESRCRCCAKCAVTPAPQSGYDFGLCLNASMELVALETPDQQGCLRGDCNLVTIQLHELLHIGFGTAEEESICEAFTHCIQDCGSDDTSCGLP
jgi:hypothetical protein